VMCPGERIALLDRIIALHKSRRPACVFRVQDQGPLDADVVVVQNPQPPRPRPTATATPNQQQRPQVMIRYISSFQNILLILACCLSRVSICLSGPSPVPSPTDRFLSSPLLHPARPPWSPERPTRRGLPS
jgi:hypothetical protein